MRSFEDVVHRRRPTRLRDLAYIAGRGGHSLVIVWAVVAVALAVRWLAGWA